MRIPLLADPPVLVTGARPLTERVLSALQRAGRRANALSSLDLGGLRLRRGQTLVLADPPDAARLVPGLLADLGARVARGRGGPARAVLMHQAEPPPDWIAGLHATDAQGPLRLETFALEDQAARAVLARWPLHFGMDPAFGQRPHLLIAGWAAPARALLVQALRLIHYGEERPRVTLVCADPRAAAARFALAYPQAGRIATIDWIAPETLRLADLPPLTQVLVALDQPAAGLDLARALAHRIAAEQGGSPPILAETGDLPRDGRLADWDGQTFPFSYLELACAPEVLLDGRVDRLAQTIHEHYTDSIAAQGRDPQREPAGRPWDQLAGSYRDANRHQADHLWAKLAVTDCRAVPEERVESFAFAPLETERLAVVEHLRWAADRYLDGWTHAPVRDNARRHHPQLIPYPELSEPMKDLDRFAVRGVPNLLARSGLGVVRMLILGIAQAPGLAAGPALTRMIRETVERLVARYPDRYLAVATTLAHPAARLFARLALERAGAGLFLLCPRPLQETLAAQPSEAARLDLLGLVARAERRIPLAAPGELARWQARRVQIRVRLGDARPALDAGPDVGPDVGPEDGAVEGRRRGPQGAPAGTPKEVVLDPADGRVRWGFEY